MGSANLVDELSDTKRSGPAGGCGLPPEKSSGSTQRKWNGDESRRDFREVSREVCMQVWAPIRLPHTIRTSSARPGQGTTATVAQINDCASRAKGNERLFLGQCLIHQPSASRRHLRLGLVRGGRPPPRAGPACRVRWPGIYLKKKLRARAAALYN